MRQTALTCLAVLLILPMLAFFSPASHAAEPTEADRQEALERLQLLKEQLIELKEELARVKAEKAREAQSAPIASGDAAWVALPGLDQHPEGYGLYAYVLITSRTSQQDAIAVLTLLETGPGSQADKTLNSTLFLVPADDKDGRIMIENYKEVLSNRMLKSSGLLDAAGPVLLLSIDPFLDTLPGTTLSIELGGQDAASIKAILQQLLQPQPTGAEPLVRMRDIAWQLADIDRQKKTYIDSSGSHLRVSWNR